MCHSCFADKLQAVDIGGFAAAGSSQAGNSSGNPFDSPGAGLSATAADAASLGALAAGVSAGFTLPGGVLAALAISLATYGSLPLIRPPEAAARAGSCGPAVERWHDRQMAASHSLAMTPDEMESVMREIGWSVAELAARLAVRRSTVGDWLNGRRNIPPNLERWLYQVRDAQAVAPAQPDGWRGGAGC